jgi:hypothetical protein
MLRPSHTIPKSLWMLLFFCFGLRYLHSMFRRSVWTSCKPMNKKETRHCWNRHLMDTMLIFILINGILQYYCISMMDQGRSWFLPPWCGLSWPFQIYVNVYRRVPSGKRLHNYGKIHHFVAGKINYFYGHFQ